MAFCYKICLKDGQIKLETMQETVRPGQVAAKTRHQNESSLTEKGSNKNSLSMFWSNNPMYFQKWHLFSSQPKVSFQKSEVFISYKALHLFPQKFISRKSLIGIRQITQYKEFLLLFAVLASWSILVWQ